MYVAVIGNEKYWNRKKNFFVKNDQKTFIQVLDRLFSNDDPISRVRIHHVLLLKDC